MKKLMLLVFFIAGLSVNAAEVNKIVAKVNNQIITAQEIKRYAQQSGLELEQEGTYKQVLEHLIKEELILQQAREEELEIASSWVDSRLMRIKSNYPNQADFEKDLLKEGLNKNYLRKKIKQNAMLDKMINKYVNSRIVVSPREVNQYYRQHKSEFLTEPQIVVWIAKSTDEKLIAKIAETIRQEDLESALSEYNSNFFKVECKPEDMRKEIKRTVSQLKVGEFGLTQIEGAHYLIFFKQEQNQRLKPLAQVRDEIYRKLKENQFDRYFNQWIEELKSESVIKVYQSAVDDEEI
jgi:hypothetical protein